MNNQICIPGCPWALTSLTIVAPCGIGLPGAACTILGPPPTPVPCKVCPFGRVAT